MRHVFPWDLSKTISHCQSDDVCDCIYKLPWDLIHLQVWMQNISWSWTADPVQSGKGVGMSARFCPEADVHTGSWASSFLLRPTWEFGHMQLLPQIKLLFLLIRCSVQFLTSNQRIGSALYYRLSCYWYFSLLPSPFLSKEVWVASTSPRSEVSDGKGYSLP